MMTKITYYNFSSLVYASFFLTGFFRLYDQTIPFKFEVCSSAPDIFIPPVIDTENCNILANMVLFRVTKPDDEYYFCIDTRDSNDPSDERALGYHLPLLDKVRYYFKTNYNKCVAVESAVLRPHLRKIFPTAPFFPVFVREWYRVLPRLRAVPEMAWDAGSIKQRLRDIYSLIDLEDLRNFRKTPKNIDLFYVAHHYSGVGVPGEHRTPNKHSDVNDFRYQLIYEIRKRTGLKCIAGFVGEGTMSHQHEQFKVRSRAYGLRDYLHEVSRARVGLYVRGVHDCLSFKFGQLLCMGMPISGQRLANNTEWLYSLGRFQEQFAYESAKELVDKAEALVADRAELISIAESNIVLFERHFTPQKVVAEILRRQNLY